MRSRWMRSGLLLVGGLVGVFLSSCDPLPGRLRTDPPGTALNTSSSSWSTGLNQFSFKETWFRGKGNQPVVTLGKGTYEPSTAINIYEYSEPSGVVVVKTSEGKGALTTEDKVLASTIPLFKAGEVITYTLRP